MFNRGQRVTVNPENGEFLPFEGEVLEIYNGRNKLYLVAENDDDPGVWCHETELTETESA